MERHYKTIFGFWALAFILIASQLRSQTAGGANGMVFRFTKQVWLNPTIILAKQNFEQSTNVKLLILPRVNGDDTTGSSRIEKAFDKLLSFLVYKENIQGSIKFYFNPKNPSKPFTFNTSDELHCKFTPIQKDSVETILNKDIVNSNSLNNFTALPFDSIINRASRYCKKILQSKPGLCGENPGNDFTLTKINSAPAKLNFEKGANPNPAAPNGGIDVKKYAELEQYYNTILDVAENSNYPMAWKAMAANTSDVIKLKLKKKQSYFDIDKLVFKNANGTETYNVTYNNIGADSIIDLSISGKSPGSMAEVVAYYTPTTTPTQAFPIGAFNVQFYEPKTLNVVLVNIGGASTTLPDATTIRNSLNQIYSQVFVSWNVTAANCPLPLSINKNIHVENSGLLSNYMPDMQAIVSYFKDNCAAYNSSSDNTYYLLFGATNDGNLLGYMPRARNTGFIFDTEVKTIAHELGHGAFNLKHIFCSEELGQGNLTQTNNLMDYTNNINTGAMQRALYKHQWDLIHDPGSVGWFEGDDDDGSEIAVGNIEQFTDLLNGDGKTLTFITPSGKPFSLEKSKLSTIIFYSNDEASNTNSPQLYEFYSDGALRGFKTTDNKIYRANFLSNQQNQFAGYYTEINGVKTAYTDNLTKTINNGNKVIIATPCIEESQIIYKAKKVSFTGTWASTSHNGSGTYVKVLPVDYNSASIVKNLEDVLASTTLSQEAMNFLTKNASCTSEYIPYAIAVAELITKHPDIFNDCYKLQWLYLNFSKPLKNCTTCVDLTTKLQAYQAKLDELKSRLSNMGSTINEANTAIELLKAATSAQQVQQIFIDNPGIGSCGLNSLPIVNRIYLLNLLIGGQNPDETYWFVDNNILSPNDHFIVKYLITSTPKSDELTLLTNGLKANNYKWLSNLWAEYDVFLTNDVQIEDLGDLFTSLTKMVADNIGQLNISPQQSVKSFYTTLFGPQEPHVIYPGLDLLYLVGLSDGRLNDFDETVYDMENESVSIENSGKIFLYQKYSEEHGRSAVFKKDVIIPREYSYFFDPLEPVTIKIVDDFYENNYQSGTELTVPAFMAMWYVKSIHKIQNERLKRKVFDAITITAAVFSAPFTGGTSLALASNAIITAGAIAATADLYISYKRENMSIASYNSYKSYFEAWDKMKTAVDVANVAVGGIHLTKAFVTRLKSINLKTSLNDGAPTITSAPDSDFLGMKNAANCLLKAANNKPFNSSFAVAASDVKLLPSNVPYSAVPDFEDVANTVRIISNETPHYSSGVHKILRNNGALLEAVEETGSSSSGLAYAPEVIIDTETAIETALQELLQDTKVVTVGSPIPVKCASNPAAAPITAQQFTEIGSVQLYTLPSTSPSAVSLMQVLTKPSGKPKIIYCTQDIYDKLDERVKSKRQCKACSTVVQEVCIKFEMLKSKVGAGYSTGVSKLCANLSTGSTENANKVMDYLLIMNTSTCQLFLNDIVTPVGGKMISSYLTTNTLSKEFIESWEIIHEAKTAVSANYRLDKAAITELKTARSSGSFRNNIGNTPGINAVLKANKYLPCQTCINNNSFLQETDEYIKDLKYFSDNYNNADLWEDLKQQNAIKIVYGAAFQLRVLRAQSGLFIGGTATFDRSLFDDVDADNPGNDDLNPNEFRSKCRYDIKITKPTASGVVTNYFEFKSWGNGYYTTFINPTYNRASFANQLKSYLSNISDLDQLKYIFDKERLNQTQANTVLQKVFQDNADLWFNGGTFEAKLKNLFNVTDKADFKLKIADLNNPIIYEFVEIY